MDPRLLTNQKHLERVDGAAYVYGSREHHDAIERSIERRRRLLEGSPLAARLDANQTAFLARDLTYVSQEVQRVLYERLRASEFIPVKSDVPRGAQTWVYRQMDIRGEARAGAHLHADDAPSADVSIEEFPFPVTHVTASYQYTLEELEAAAFAGVPLSRDKANACAEIIARKLDKLMRIGDAAQGITGFFNNPNVPVVTLTNGEWLTATAAEIIADWAQVEQAVISQSRDVHQATRLVLPTAYEGHLVSTPKDATSDMSLARWLLANARSIKQLERWIALDDATGADVGVADPPQGIAYDPNPDFVFAEMPVPYEELPPQARGYGWVVPARAVFGGVVFKRPNSAAYVENLD